jgi:HK97 family phage major capsid protein
MSSLLQLEAQHDAAIAKADAIVSAVERQKRPLTTHEQLAFDNSLREANELKPRIAAAKSTSTRSTAEVRAILGRQPRQTHREPSNGTRGELILPARFSRDYHDAFHSRLSGQGVITASMNEGLSNSGGFAVPVVVDSQVTSLAPQDSAVRRLSTVVSTRSDIKVPQITVRGVASAKSETSSFGVAAPSLGQTILSAFATGVETQISQELAEDAPLFASAVLEDVTSAFLEEEEAKFINGSGSGEPQGLIGNVGAGVVAEPDGSGNTVTTAGIRSLIGTLKESYALNASFLLTKTTALIIRASQTQSGLYEPAFSRVGNQDFLFGYPIAYSSQMATATRGNTPVLFGDFRKAYLIADRGGSALLMKVLDQANAVNGLIDLLFYRRSDGRVRRSEAVQGLTIAAS